MARRRFNREVLTTALSACLNWCRFTVGATGAVGTLKQAKSNSIRSITRNSAGNYTVQFNEPYPVAIAAAFVQLHRAAVSDAVRVVDMDAATYSNTTGQLVLFTSTVEDVTATAPVAATGTVTAVTNALMTDGDFITISDGINPAVVYEYDKAADGVVAGRVNWAAGASTADDVANTLKTAIQANQPAITVTGPTAGVLTLTHDIPGAFANVTITENVSNAGFTVAGMSGGVNAALTVNAQAAADPVQDSELHMQFVELRGPQMDV